MLDAQELNLTHDEALCLATTRQACSPGPVDQAHIGRLLLQTQGWIAGFTLLLNEAGRVDGQHSTASTQQLLFDYFATEMFGKFDPAQQDALMRTALLPTMTAADAERLCGHAAVGSLLTSLHRQNCFIVMRGHAEPQRGGAPGLIRTRFVTPARLRWLRLIQASRIGETS